jgi:hypothetical protein
MLSERALVEAIFNTALRGAAGETAARRDALWTAATTLMADVLLSYDPFNRERLLRGLEKELRVATKHLAQCIAEEEERAEAPPGKFGTHCPCGIAIWDGKSKNVTGCDRVFLYRRIRARA